MQPKTHIVAPLGRFLLSLIFVASAAGKLADWNGTLKMLVDKDLPSPDVLLSIAVALEIIGGLMVMLGFFARWGAVALLLFIVPASVLMHNFWAADPSVSQMQMINFMKNVSITGGLLLVLAFGSGPFSLDSLLRRKSVGPA